MPGARVVLRAGLIAILAVTAAVRSEDEYVTKAQFQELLSQFKEFREENNALKSQNVRLEREIKNVQAALKKSQPVDASISTYMQAKTGEAPVNAGTDRFATPGDKIKLLIAGWADAGYQDRHGAPSTFTSSFHPTFLWKVNDQISFETDFDYQVLQYRFDDLLEFEAGSFLTPLGAFYRDYRETWINKLPDRPFVYDPVAGIAPEFSTGAMLDGAFKAGPTTFNWNAYVTNGPALITGDPRHFGELNFSNGFDNNRNKALGGRLGWSPLPELQAGFSGQTGRAGTNGTPQRDVSATIVAADLSYVRDICALKGTVDVKSEWVWSKVSNATYTISGDDIAFNDNRRNGSYAQVSYRPTMIDQKWVRNLELAFRYDRLENPPFHSGFPAESRPEHVNFDREAMGLDYWVAPTAVFKFAYETGTHDDRALLFQFAIGF